MADVQFGRQYAALYDLFYEGKSYEQECDFVEAAFRRFSSSRPRSVLDIGCGTGGHAVPLAVRGYDVIGIDQSEGMLAIAQDKARAAGVRPVFHRMAAQDLRLPNTVDAALCLFNVIDYFVDDEAFAAALRAVERHLNPGGLFVLDYRNGFPSTLQYSAERVIERSRNGSRVMRISRNTVDPWRQRFRTEYECLVFDGDRCVDRFIDSHDARFFFPEEMTLRLSVAGFELLHSCAFPDLDEAVDPMETWNVGVVARRRS